MSYSIKPLQMNQSSDSDMRETAARICRDYLTGAWKHVTADDIQFKRISGGLSNFLYHVALPIEQSKPALSPKSSLPALAPTSALRQSFSRSRHGSFSTSGISGAEAEPNQVLLRIYGQIHGEQAIEALITESVVFTLLSERKLGPKLHGVFPGGRIEQYIPARPLLTSEMADSILSVKIAEKMAAIHSMDVPLCKEPDWLWKTVNRWLKKVESNLATFNSNDENDKRSVEKIKSFDLHKEIEWLTQYISTIDSPVVFCHNDMQEGNILLKEECSNHEELNPLEQCLLQNSDLFDSRGDESMNYPQDETDEFIKSDVIIHNEEACDFTQQMSALNTGSCDAPSELFFEKSHVINFHNKNERSSKENNHTSMPISSTPTLTDTDIIECMDCDNTGDSAISHSLNSCSSCEPQLVLIDFEYCSYNYRGFDLANHFVEWSYDYTKPEHPYFYDKFEQYPTREQQERFVKAYLQSSDTYYNGHPASPTRSSRSGSNSGLSNGDQAVIERCIENQPSDEEVEQVLDEVVAFTMASHLFWGLWAAVNAPMSQIPFGYWDYAVSRLERYFAGKKQVISPLKSNLKRKLT